MAVEKTIAIGCDAVSSPRANHRENFIVVKLSKYINIMLRVYSATSAATVAVAQVKWHILMTASRLLLTSINAQQYHHRTLVIYHYQQLRRSYISLHLDRVCLAIDLILCYSTRTHIYQSTDSSVCPYVPRSLFVEVPLTPQGATSHRAPTSIIRLRERQLTTLTCPEKAKRSRKKQPILDATHPRSILRINLYPSSCWLCWQGSLKNYRLDSLCLGPSRRKTIRYYVAF